LIFFHPAGFFERSILNSKAVEGPQFSKYAEGDFFQGNFTHDAHQRHSRFEKMRPNTTETE
jgi:hypothetical protein